MKNFPSDQVTGQPKNLQVTRDDAPEGLRGFLIQLLYELEYSPSTCRQIICRVLRSTPDRNTWSEFPNIDGEVHDLISSCEWYYVYDIIESFAEKMDLTIKIKFQSELNDYFKVNGIGWKLVNGRIEYRGEENFENALRRVVTVLEGASLSTAKSEIKEAITDLSRRPQPDITGAIQHSLASLECVSREATGDKNSTLGDLMKKYPGVIPTPLDQAVTKIWDLLRSKDGI